MGDARLLDAMYKDGYICALTGKHMGELTDGLAKRYGISPRAAGRVRLREPAARGRGEGVRIQRPDDRARSTMPQGRGQVLTFQDDEHARADTTPEKLARLSPAFGKDGTITAGNASGITDGAAAVIVTSREKADTAWGWSRWPTVRSYGIAAVEPADFGIAPVASQPQGARQAGDGVKDLDLVEINEAFAAQMLAVMHDLDLPRDKVNVHGGAIALGHPTGHVGRAHRACS